LWIGYNFNVGRNLVLEATPMIGAVVGKTVGIAPGYNVSLTYNRLSLSSSGEFVFDARHRSESFFYSWPQLAYSVTDWMRLGLAAQRTKAYQTELDIQRGVFIGLSYKKVEFTGYVFNFGWTEPTVVLEAAFSF